MPKVIDDVLYYTVQEVAATGKLSETAIRGRILRHKWPVKRVVAETAIGRHREKILIPQDTANLILSVIKRAPKRRRKKMMGKDAAMRECLKCGKLFPSEHKANRICRLCTESNAGHYALAGVILSLQEPK